jgi:hypothetical protein
MLLMTMRMKNEILIIKIDFFLQLPAVPLSLSTRRHTTSYRLLGSLSQSFGCVSTVNNENGDV